jgi:hypothetical protein
MNIIKTQVWNYLGSGKERNILLAIQKQQPEIYIFLKRWSRYLPIAMSVT